MNKTPDPADFADDRTMDETCCRFIERMGEHMEVEGLPRIAGRLFGLILVDRGPISFSALAERLGVSRGSISTNARLLEHKGLIERVHMDGERQDFFRLADQPFVNMIRGIAERMRETMTMIEDSGLATDPADSHEGVVAARDFFAAAVEDLERLAVRLAETPSR